MRGSQEERKEGHMTCTVTSKFIIRPVVNDAGEKYVIRKNALRALG